MAHRRYSKKECRERGQVALIASVVALSLLAGTWIYAQKRIAECGHAHVCVKYIILDVIDLAYHETIMAAAGDQAEQILEDTVKKNKKKYICVCEGGIPTKDGGVYGKIHGKTFVDVANHVVKNAAATVCVGNCACFGGVQAAKPNPTEAKSVSEVTGV